MKTNIKNKYYDDGIFINLDEYYTSSENLLLNHQKYLNKDSKYYIYCLKGIKSKKVTRVLEAYGYDVTLVLN
ncbi:MAG: hypothetical protein PHF21_03395 [Bacilli bacterium]|nr:hypothetical protein [Bacilli bacterium]